MKTKCPVCNSCTQDVWVNYNVYRYCDFCRVYFIPLTLNPVSVEFITKERKIELETLKAVEESRKQSG